MKAQKYFLNKRDEIMMLKEIKQTTKTLIFLLAAMLMAGEARGSLIEFTFGGNITFSNGTPPAPWDLVGVGSEFLVTYVFDSETPDQATQNVFGRYDIVSASVTLDGITQVASGGGEIVVNLINSPVLQEYSLSFSGLPGGGNGSINLFGTTALDSDALPTTINLNDWWISQSFGLGFIESESEISGGISSFTSRIVPVPSLFIPLGILGFLSLHGRRRSPGEGHSHRSMNRKEIR